MTGRAVRDPSVKKGTSSEFVVHLGSSLKKTGMEIEDVTGVGFSSWGSSQ